MLGTLSGPVCSSNSTGGFVVQLQYKGICVILSPLLVTELRGFFCVYDLSKAITCDKRGAAARSGFKGLDVLKCVLVGFVLLYLYYLDLYNRKQK